MVRAEKDSVAQVANNLRIKESLIYYWRSSPSKRAQENAGLITKGEMIEKNRVAKIMRKKMCLTTSRCITKVI
jgi:transposase-like protein